jgi:murein DD-endopeptidase MepM/ murein hydrolase activator NlpD
MNLSFYRSKTHLENCLKRLKVRKRQFANQLINENHKKRYKMIKKEINELEKKLRTIDKENYCQDSATGCHVAYFEADWIIKSSPFNTEDFDCSIKDFPDISLDTFGNKKFCLLTIINNSDAVRSYFVSTSHVARDIKGNVLQTGKYRDNEGNEGECVTFILLLKPQYIMDVCYLDLTTYNGANKVISYPFVDLSSDIKDLPFEPYNFNPLTDYVYVFPFPLLHEKNKFLCSQGHGGRLTHFFPGTWHAIDIECPIGTPVLSVGDGEVPFIINFF